MKQQEIRRNKGKKTKKLRKKRPKIQQKEPRFCGGFFWAIFHYKTGHFLRFLPIFGPPIEVTAIYIYIRKLPPSYLRTQFGLTNGNFSGSKKERTMTARDVAGFCAFFSARKSGNFWELRMGGVPERGFSSSWRGGDL